MTARPAVLIGPALLATALLLPACGESTSAPAEPPLYTHFEVEVGGVDGGGSRATLDGVVFEVSFDVAISMPGNADSHVQINGSSHLSFVPDARQPLLDGRALSVAGGRLMIGDTDHGAIAPGDVVVVSSDGVQIERVAP